MLRRLGPLDKALVLILVPLWAICFSLALRVQVHGGGVAQLELRVADEESYPALTGNFVAFVHQGRNPLAEAGLRAGDLLVRVGSADLLGVGNVGFIARVHEEAGRDLSVPVVFEREGVRQQASLPLASISFAAPPLFSAFAFVAAALFLILRGQPTPAVRAFFYSGMCTGIFRSSFPGEGIQLYVWLAVF